VTRTVWLASYPKSGSTWFRMLAANLYANDGEPVDINDLGDRIASARTLFDHLLLVESGLLTHDEIDSLRPRFHEELALAAEVDAEDSAAPPVRFIKVHDAYTRNARNEPLLAGRRGAEGVILIVRDPRDVAPSLASHNRTGLDEAIEFMNDDEACYCAKPGRQYGQFRQKLLGWSRHVASWLEQTDLPVHLMRYEDMQDETISAFRRALEFAGMHASGEEIERAVRHASFAELQRQEREKGFGESPREPGGPFFRRGAAGAWQDELNARQLARIEAAHGPMMQRLGYQLASAAPLARTA
jgi:aryl sulfotransferase